MLVLGIDTSTKTGSIALYDTEIGIISEITLHVSLNHSDTLMTAINDVMIYADKKLEDIDRIAVSIGPGSFTGIRVGVGTAKGLSFSLDKPIIGINELDALANTVSYTDLKIMSLIDARKERVYYCEYFYDDYEKISKINKYNDGNLNEFLLQYKNEKIIFTGDGSIKYKKLIRQILKEKAIFNKTSNSQIRASIVAELGSIGKIDNMFNLEPFYLSKSQAEIQKENNYGG